MYYLKCPKLGLCFFSCVPLFKLFSLLECPSLGFSTWQAPIYLSRPNSDHFLHLGCYPISSRISLYYSTHHIRPPGTSKPWPADQIQPATCFWMAHELRIVSTLLSCWKSKKYLMKWKLYEIPISVSINKIPLEHSHTQVLKNIVYGCFCITMTALSRYNHVALKAKNILYVTFIEKYVKQLVVSVPHEIRDFWKTVTICIHLWVCSSAQGFSEGSCSIIIGSRNFGKL